MSEMYFAQRAFKVPVLGPGKGDRARWECFYQPAGRYTIRIHFIPLCSIVNNLTFCVRSAIKPSTTATVWAFIVLRPEIV